MERERGADAPIEQSTAGGFGSAATSVAEQPILPRLRRGQVEGASMVPAAVFLGLSDPPRRGNSSAGAPLATRVWR